MYNITEIKEQTVAPIKDWKWQPKVQLNLSRKDRANFSKWISTKKIGNQWIHGRGL